MKTTMYKLPVLVILFFLFALSFESCKKKGEEITAEKLEAQLSAGESSQWKFPSALHTDETVEQQCFETGGDVLLLLKSDGTYEYSIGGAATPSPCAAKGTWSVTYAVNRTGQDISLTLTNFYSDGNTLTVKLQYSNNIFYYLDAVKGLVPIEKIKRLEWVNANVTVPSQLQGRVDMVSVEHGGKVYFGLGKDQLQPIFFNDWYEFDGKTITAITSPGAPLLSGAKACVHNGVIKILGGEDDMFNQNSQLYIFDPTSGWTTGTNDVLQQRVNGTYFSLNNKEVIGLGYSFQTQTSDFYVRSNLNWISLAPALGGYYGGATNPGSPSFRDLLCFPWNGGQFIGGGFDGEGYTDYSALISNNLGAVTMKASGIPPILTEGYSEGNGIDLGNGEAIVFGIKSSVSGYTPGIHYFNGVSWKVVGPKQPSGVNVLPSRSSVLWKVRNSTGQIDIYAGLWDGANMGLYKLIIK